MGSSQSTLGNPPDKPRTMEKEAIPAAKTITSNSKTNKDVAVIPSSSNPPGRPVVTTTRPHPQTLSSTATSQPADLDLNQLLPTLKFGAYSTSAGLLFGTFHGILRSKPLFIFSLASGIQWGLVGMTFHGSRALAINSLGNTRGTRMPASTLAAALAGGMAGALAGGRRSVMPGAFVFALFGLGGQWVREEQLQRRLERGEEELAQGKSLLERVTRSRWSPLQMLTDSEYKEILEGKLMKVDVEIAVLQDDIKALREQSVKDRKDGESKDRK